MLIHTNEQPTLFDTEVSRLEAVAESIPEQPIAEPLLNQILTGPSLNSSLPEKKDFRAVSPLANIALREACAYCRAEILGLGFVILDYEELGAFCDEECANKRFRLYLYDMSYESA
jgi:hypothetical protein